MVDDLKRGSGRLLVCTRGAQRIGTEAVSPLQSALWGLHSVLRAEYPEWNPVIVDLDPADPHDPDLAEIAMYSASEDRLAIRNGECVVPRLAPASTRSETPLPIGADRTYLVTGGLGALGLWTAQWLCARGATHLVLCGRNQPAAEALESVDKLRSGGANILIERADAARMEDVERLFRNVESTMPRIAGIVHAAGVLHDGFMEKQTFESFLRVMAPKVEGAWNLQRQTEGRQLDFFVCYSSIAALVASPGQGPYAAANAFLDGLMGGIAAGLSVGWGPWDSEGMAASGSLRTRERWQASGVNFLSPEAAISFLERAMRLRLPYVAAFDFATMAARLADSDVPSILSELRSTRRPPRPMREPVLRDDLLASLRAADSSRRFELLSHYLREQAGRVLGHEGPVVELGESLTVLGIDSLMAVELRSAVTRELGVEVPISRFLDGSGIVDLAELLAGQISQSGAPERAMAASAGAWMEGEL
jgi:NAD(P)-dependent dehydrogenase (short-subunit alcohol dehydrogenase family)/acyl carrier protein